MQVITKYPIVVTNNAAETDSVYRSTYSNANGGGSMEVLTKYPIVHTDSDAQSQSEYRSTYSNAFGDGWLTSAAGRERRAKRRAENKKSGNTFGNKVGKFAQSDLGKGLLGGILGGGAGAGVSTDMGDMPPIEEEKGMSTGMKVALIGGGVAVLGLVAYLVMRKK